MNLEEKYKGRTATEYLAKRVDAPHWRREQEVVREMLEAANGSRVVDVPVGTGRFLEFYKALRLDAVGLDISPDMLNEARACAKTLDYRSLQLRVGDIRALPLDSSSADVVVCIRYMQHVSLREFQAVITELVRVTSGHLILGVHILHSHRGGVFRVLRAVMTSPFAMVRRMLTQVRRRRQARIQGERPPVTTRDKPDSAVRECFSDLGLSIRSEKLIATGLNPRRPVEYRIFHLEKQ